MGILPGGPSLLHPVQMSGHQVRDHLAVSGGAKYVALAQQAFFQLDVVLDHAIVDHCHDVLPAQMRMGIRLGGSTVSSPTRMPDPDRPWQRGRGTLSVRPSTRPIVLRVAIP